MADYITVSRDGLDLASVCNENHSNFDDLFLEVETMPVADYLLHDMPEGADVRSIDTGESPVDVVLQDQDCQASASMLDTKMESPVCMEYLELSPNPCRRRPTSRKEKTPDTVLAILEKHRHSERIRHHTLNERLNVICKLVPGSAEDGKETKVVMMQRVISYIAYLENTISFLCSRLGVQPSERWLLLTTNSKDCLGTNYDELAMDEELAAATAHVQEVVDKGSHWHKRSSATHHRVAPDTASDSVVPDISAKTDEDGGMLSQDSGVPSSAATDEDHASRSWEMMPSQDTIQWPAQGGDLQVYFSSAVDDGISAVFEIPSSGLDNPPQVGVAAISNEAYYGTCWADQDHFHEASTASSTDDMFSSSVYYGNSGRYSRLTQYHGVSRKTHVYAHKNKRKQYSPKRSVDTDEEWQEEAKWQQDSASVKCQTSPVKVSSSSGLRNVYQVLPYNIRCNHHHDEQQRFYFTRSSAQLDCPLVHVPRPEPRPPRRINTICQDDSAPARMDLRKTSWMNGFMMFSRLNRRKYIKAHPGVHTSHISKIMGHAWRSMSAEEQAPYKEKAKACAQELYRTYTSTPDFLSAVASATSAASTTGSETNSSNIDSVVKCEAPMTTEVHSSEITP